MVDKLKLLLAIFVIASIIGCLLLQTKFRCTEVQASDYGRSSSTTKAPALSNKSAVHHTRPKPRPFRPIPLVPFNFSQVKKSRHSLTYSKKSKVPLNAFPPRPEPTGGPPLYLAYLCNAQSGCGGWGDRQEGLTFAYAVSRLVGRRFKIVMTDPPCDLSQFLTPDKVRWVPKNGELAPPSKSNTINTMSYHGRRKLQKCVAKGNFNKKCPQKVIYIKANQDLFHLVYRNAFYSRQLKEWKSIKNVRNRFYWAWHELMRPSPLLTSNLEHILGQAFLMRKGLLPLSKSKKNDSLYDVGDSKLICAHVRVGSNPSIKEGNNFRVVGLEELPLLHRFMASKDLNNDSHFFIATDYINVRIESHNFFKDRFIDYGAKIIHTDNQRRAPDACDGLRDTITDQMILSLCDVLVVCKSGFGRMAFFMRNLTESVYILDDGVVKVYDG